MAGILWHLKSAHEADFFLQNVNKYTIIKSDINVLIESNPSKSTVLTCTEMLSASLRPKYSRNV